jgi:hypothetical protein
MTIKHLCTKFEIINTIEYVVCSECGLVLDNNVKLESKYGDYNYNMYSKIELKQIGLNNYVKTILDRLEITKIIQNNIINQITNIIELIYLYLNEKGSNLKQAIVIICLCKTYDTYSYFDLAKKINLNIKNISRAEICLTQLHIKNLIPNNELLYQAHHPVTLLYNINTKKNINIPLYILQQTQLLITQCISKTNLTSSHLTSSISIACLYYISNYNQHTIDIEIFKEIYSLSINTIVIICDKIHAFVKDQLIILPKRDHNTLSPTRACVEDLYS